MNWNVTVEITWKQAVVYVEKNYANWHFEEIIIFLVKCEIITYIVR